MKSRGATLGQARDEAAGEKGMQQFRRRLASRVRQGTGRGRTTGTGMSERSEDYRLVLREAVAAEESFLWLTAGGAQRGQETPWVKAEVRPVKVKGRRRLQFSYFDGSKHITKNYARAESWRKLEELLALPFRHFHLQSAEGDLHVRITKRGRVLIRREKAKHPEREPDLAHDRVKEYPIPADAPDGFLQTIGIMDRQGRVRGTMHAKFRQINQFLKLMGDMFPPEEFGDGGVEIVDCGCGSAHLTFAAYHYFSHLQGVKARVIGVDTNRETIEKCQELRQSLGWDGMEFHVSAIAEFSPERPPDLVLSLHACDTATDEAIAQGIRWESSGILAAPCCQHELHTQLEAPTFRPVLRHGILKERTADILTDAFRALVLRIMGYRTDVVEFVSPEHTSKNLMIRAKRALKPGDPRLIEEYRDLKRFWDVDPCIERLVGEEFVRRVSDREIE
jgi:SAM-dependent methyltransferase